MTKKVLISLEELQERCLEYHYDISPNDWFDAQPDIGLMNINELIGHKVRALSKMETTGGKDDNDDN